MAQARRAADELPSLPQVLSSILDALQDDDADLQNLSTIILQDIGITAKLIAVANSSVHYRGRHCASLERAVLNLGLSTVKTVAITAAVQQVFDQFSQRRQGFLKGVWRKALTTASLGQALAALTRYPRPEEAYLAGLLVDIGRLARLTADESGYWRLLEGAANDRDLVVAETAALGSDHCTAAANLMEDWGLSPFIVDAVRYHLEPGRAIRDAHHLVKVINLAYALASSETVPDQTLETADMLFGLNEGLTRELRGRVEDDVAHLAQSLQIDISLDSGDDQDRGARQTLGERLQDLQQLEQLKREMTVLEQPKLQQIAVQRVLFLTFGVEETLLFLADDETHLRAWIEDEVEPVFVLGLERGRSRVSDALLDRVSIQVTQADRDSLSVADRQIFSMCKADALWIQPLLSEDRALGALVLGLAPDQLTRMKQRSAFVQALGNQVMKTLIPPKTTPVTTEQSGLERHIREMVHEASNPLSIIQNYLSMLRIKLGEEHTAQIELAAIREEIDRVGRILLRMREPPEGSGQGAGSLNDEVRQVTNIFAASVGTARNIVLEVDLSPADPPLVQSADHIRQILTNLLKNAAEALEGGGRISVTTRDPVSVSGRGYSELIVQDDGPGLPQSVMDQLFSPVQSTKGKEHSGLGLSIVKRLADDMGALILCSTSTSGTRFQLLLPHAEQE
ncbi:MAG TPA: HDOD domain-containing protein [Thioalkalivibrio sp.]|nr:HDOD domain-containing protein [Thioalkalivibrio sp.]